MATKAATTKVPQVLTLTVRDDVRGAWLVLTAPFRPSMPYRARDLGGRWNARGKTWGFPLSAIRGVLGMCRIVYDRQPALCPRAARLLEQATQQAVADLVGSCDGTAPAGAPFGAETTTADELPEAPPPDLDGLDLDTLPAAPPSAQPRTQDAVAADCQKPPQAPGAADPIAQVRALEVERMKLLARMAEIDEELLRARAKATAAREAQDGGKFRLLETD